MKQFIYLMAFACMGLNVNAQETAVPQTTIEGIKATVQSSNLHISWKSNKSETGYWEVQASRDGKHFTTIGLVMGEDPGIKGSFAFKQQTNKLKPGLAYFRVLQIETAGEALASNTIGLTK